jgi:ABC-type transport system involved in multi-copper enzyme maturation permease subunit
LINNPLTAWQKNPVIVNELRSRMRGRRTYFILAAHLFLLSALAFIIYLTIYEQTQVYSYYGGGFQQKLEASSTLGKSIFYGTVFLLLFIVSLVGPAFSAGAIVSEKDRQTYDLLVITALSAREIVMAKLNAILVFMGLLILATLPFQGMAYFFGGVAFGEVLVATLVLLLTALLFCSMGLFVSSFARSTTIANMVNYAIIIPLLLGIPFFVFLIGVLSSGVFFDRLSSNPPLVLAVPLSYGILLFLSINPLSMAVTSEMFIQETGSYFFSVERFFDHQIPIIAPWLVYAVFCLVVSYLFIHAAVRRVNKMNR